MAFAFKDDWICPNLTEIELFGDPYFEIHNNGKSFNMIVNSCLEAQKQDQEMMEMGYKNVTYTDVECADEDTIDNNVEKVINFVKIMTQI